MDKEPAAPVAQIGEGVQRFGSVERAYAHQVHSNSSTPTPEILRPAYRKKKSLKRNEGNGESDPLTSNGEGSGSAQAGPSQRYNGASSRQNEGLMQQMEEQAKIDPKRNRDGDSAIGSRSSNSSQDMLAIGRGTPILERIEEQERRVRDGELNPLLSITQGRTSARYRSSHRPRAEYFMQIEACRAFFAEGGNGHTSMEESPETVPRRKRKEDPASQQTRSQSSRVSANRPNGRIFRLQPWPMIQNEQSNGDGTILPRRISSVENNGAGPSHLPHGNRKRARTQSTVASTSVKNEFVSDEEEKEEEKEEEEEEPDSSTDEYTIKYRKPTSKQIHTIMALRLKLIPPYTSLKLRIPKNGKKKVKTNDKFFEPILDSCNKWLSPSNAVEKGMRDLDKKDFVWTEGDKHKVVIIAAGTVAKEMATKAEELVRGQVNTRILQTITLGPEEYDLNGNIKSEVMTKVAASIKKLSAREPKFLFLVTRNAENVMYGLKNGITDAMAKEVNSIIDTEENSEMADIVSWKLKDIKKGIVSQHIKKGSIHGIVFCGAPKLTKTEPTIAPNVMGHSTPGTSVNDYPTFGDVYGRLADILKSFDEPVQDGLAVEVNCVVHLKYIVTSPTELLRTIGENFKQYDCDCRVIPRTPPVSEMRMGSMLVDLMRNRNFAQSPLMDPIELDYHEYPLVLIFNGTPTKDHPAIEDRYEEIMQECLKKLKLKPELRRFTLLSAKFFDGKFEGRYFSNDFAFSNILKYHGAYDEEMIETEFSTRSSYDDMEKEDSGVHIGEAELEGCEYIVHVLILF